MNFLREPRFVTNTIIEHSQLRDIFSCLNTRELNDHGRDLIQTIVTTEFDHRMQTPTVTPVVGASQSKTTMTAALNHHYIIQTKKKILSTTLTQKELDAIRRCTGDIAQVSLNINKEPMGMGYNADKALGTDKHIFSVLGPHRGQSYGEIVLVFKRDLMLHPASHFSIPAATLF
jgi:hypothetical protein